MSTLPDFPEAPTRSVRRVPVRFAAGALVAITAGCASSTLGDNMGVDVGATGNAVQLDWDAAHAWHPQLAARGARLVAEYKVEGKGLVREVVGTSARLVRERGIDFALPEALKNVPIGNVCLYVQLQSSNALLPVRKAAGGQDTARFRFPAWEAQVASRSRERFLAADAATLEQQLRDTSNLRQRRTEALAQRGWATPQACVAAAPRRAEPDARPVGVVPADQHDAVARQVCVHRVDYSRRLFLSRLSSAPVDKRADLMNAFGGLAVAAPEAAEILLKLQPGADGIPAATLQARQRQARELADDWRRFASKVGKDYWPAFGRQDDYLEAIGEAKAGNAHLLRQLFGAKVGLPEPAAAPPMRDQIGALGSLMDAYTGCVDDGRRQLKTNAESWAALQAASPERERRLREYYVNECRQEHQRVEALQATESQLGTDLKRVQESLAAGGTAPASLPVKKQALNAARCEG